MRRRCRRSYLLYAMVSCLNEPSSGCLLLGSLVFRSRIMALDQFQLVKLSIGLRPHTCLTLLRPTFPRYLLPYRKVLAALVDLIEQCTLCSCHLSCSSEAEMLWCCRLISGMLSTASTEAQWLVQLSAPLMPMYYGNSFSGHTRIHRICSFMMHLATWLLLYNPYKV